MRDSVSEYLSQCDLVKSRINNETVYDFLTNSFLDWEDNYTDHEWNTYGSVDWNGFVQFLIQKITDFNEDCDTSILDVSTETMSKSLSIFKEYPHWVYPETYFFKSKNKIT